MARKLSAELRIDVKTLNVKALDDLARKLSALTTGGGRGGGLGGVTAANANAVARASQQAARSIGIQIRSAQMAQREQEKLERWKIATQIRSAQMAARQQAAEEKASEKRIAIARREQEQKAALLRKQAIAQTPVEREISRFRRLEETRQAREQARQQLGLPGPGGFLQGHGFTTRARQMVGALRDITVAGYGARAALYGAQTVTEPLREYQSLLAETKNKGQFGAADMKRIEQLARTMGRTSQFSPTQALGGALELAAAGVKPDEMQEALPSTLRFAQSSGLGTQQSAGLLVETASQFGLGAAQFERIGDVMTKAANMSTISVADLGESLKYVAPIARTAGLDVGFVAGTLALLGENGLKGSQGGTAFRRALTGLVKPSKQAVAALGEIGMSPKDLAAGIGSPQAFMKLFQKLNARMDKRKLGTAARMRINKLVFGEEGIAATDILGRAAMDKSAKGWEQYTEQVQRADGAMQDAANTMGQTLNGRIDAMKAKIETATITITEQYLPSMEKIVAGVGQLANTVGDNPWIADATLLLGGAVLASKVAAALSGALLSAEATAAITAAGATLGSTLFAAIAAGVGGYALGEQIAKGLGLKTLAEQESTTIGTRGLLTPEEQARRAAFGFNPEGSGPLNNEAWKQAGGVEAPERDTFYGGPAQAPFSGSLEISIASTGKPKIEKLTTSDGRLFIGTNVGAR